MHEFALVTGIVRTARDAAREHGATNITRVRVEIGLLACIEARTLRECFAIVTEGAEGGMAQGATLQVDIAPLPCTCNSCGQAFALSQRVFVCPICAHQDIDFTGGHGCRIMAIEVVGDDVAKEKLHG